VSTFGTIEHPLEPDTRFGEISFVGRRLVLLSLAFKNTVLMIFTFGFYRFWAKTWVRRYFWNNIRITGDSVEYVGQARELFIGFLIAIAILFPFATVYELFSALFLGASDWAQAAWSLVYVLAIFSLIQVAIYRAFRYRLTRTTWRGLRFGLDGSVISYVLLAFGWSLLTVFTLGIAFPWMRVALMRYRINKARYGSTKFEFDGSGRALIGVWLINYVILIAAAVSFGTFPPLGFLFVAAAIFVFIYYRVREFRYFVGATTIAGVTFESFAETPRVIWICVLTGIVLLVGMAAIFLIIGAVAGITSISSVTQAAGDLSSLDAGFESDPGLWTVAVISVVLTLVLGFRVTVAVLLQYPLMVHVCSTLAISDPTRLDQVVRSTEVLPSFGEGLAEAFDVG
jgi:uncharacterized membrane protein YjgN (DUF898 family)